MSDIHQEWRELRKKNGDFLCHLDGEMAKLEKKQVELKRRDQMQDLVDAGAFAVQFVAPPPFNCCQDDRDILKALNKAQADRIKSLEDEFLACKEQQRVDQAVKKDLDEKLDKAAADYKALWVERDNLMDTIARMEKTIRDLDERNGTLRVRLANADESLKRSVQRECGLKNRIDYLEHLRQCQAKEIERLRGSSSIYTQQGMQSKIAKQANEIKRLTEENERLKRDNEGLSEKLSDQTQLACNRMFERDVLKHKFEQLTEENEQLKHNTEILIKELRVRTQKLSDQNAEIQNLKEALDAAAKDADVNFERGKIKGMTEIWKELVDCYEGRPTSENNKIFGYYTVGDILMNLSPTWFINRAEEYHKQKETEEARDIKIGDEVEVFDTFCPDDNPHSDFGIVTAVDEDHECFVVVGPKFEGCFDMTDIDAGNVRKTGEHYDSIPINYFT